MPKKAKVSALEEDILTLLYSGQEFYGLGLLRMINKGRPVQTTPGTLSPALNRLLDRQLVSCHWGDGSKGARRKYYRITEAGRQALQSLQQYRRGLASAAAGEFGGKA